MLLQNPYYIYVATGGGGGSPPAIVQSTPVTIRNGAASASVTISGVTAGNALIITSSTFSTKANDPPLIKDGTTTLTQYYSYVTPGGSYSSAAIAWELGVAAGSHAITVACSSAITSGYYNFMVHEVSGLGTTQPSVSTSGTSTTTSLTLAGATPATNNCIVFAVISDDGNNSSSTATIPAPSGYTQLWADLAGSSSQVGAAFYQIQTTAAPVAPAWTGLKNGGGSGWGAIAVAFTT